MASSRFNEGPRHRGWRPAPEGGDGAATPPPGAIRRRFGRWSAALLVALLAAPTLAESWKGFEIEGGQ